MRKAGRSDGPVQQALWEPGDQPRRAEGSSPKTARQEGRELGHAAAKRAADHADRALTKAAWSAAAYSLFVRYAWICAGEFITKNAREHAERVWKLPPPPDPRAWGHIAKRALSNGVVRFVREHEAPHVHGGKIAVWQLAGPADSRRDEK